MAARSVTQSSAEQLEPTRLSPLFYALFSLFHFHGGYQECPPPARLINNCIQCPCRSSSRDSLVNMAGRRPHWSCGGLTPTRPLHTLGHHLRVEQCAVPLKSLDCRVSSPVFTMQIRSTESTTAMLHSPLSSGATQGVHSATVCRSSEPRESAPSAHPDVCAESRSLEVDAHDRHSLSRDAVPADRCIGTGRHPSAASHRREYLPSACLPSRSFFCLAGQDRHPPGVADA